MKVRVNGYSVLFLILNSIFFIWQSNTIRLIAITKPSKLGLYSRVTDIINQIWRRFVC